MEQTIAKAFTKANSDIKGRLDSTYQRDGVKWMLRRELEQNTTRGGILADDMGLGKTMQTIACMRGNPMRTLVVSMVGPLNQWKDALIEFGGYRPIILNPSFKGSLPEANVNDVVVTSYSTFQKQVPPSCLYENTWGRVVLDEGHTIKNPNSKTHKEIAKLCSTVKWVLSGTPIQNSEKDLLALASWIGISTSLSVEELVETYVLRRTQEAMSASNPRLALPKLETHIMKIPFATAEEESFYGAVEEYFSECAIDNPADAMTCLTRCRQACTNPSIYMAAMSNESGRTKKAQTKKQTHENKYPIWTPDMGATKLEYIVDNICQHVKKEKCLVFCMWTEEMSSLSAALKGKGVASLIYDGGLSRDNKEAALYNFKNTDIPVLIIQINCGATGLNLQCASRVYITSPNWNPCIELQAIGRAYRKGQTHVVTCIRTIIEGTVEERCMEIQESKMSIITAAMRDTSLVNRLGGLQKNLDDINITEIFRARRKKRKRVHVVESDSEKEGDGVVEHPINKDPYEFALDDTVPTCVPQPPSNQNAEQPQLVTETVVQENSYVGFAESPNLPDIHDAEFMSFLDNLLFDEVL